jgi:hypothetical protein
MEHLVGEQLRVVELDLSDLRLDGDLSSPQHVAAVVAYVYERFVPFADDGWEWLDQPTSSDFQGWLREPAPRGSRLRGVRLVCRRGQRIAQLEPEPRPVHGVSGHRTRQLTAQSWTAEPGSKIWKEHHL